MENYTFFNKIDCLNNNDTSNNSSLLENKEYTVFIKLFNGHYNVKDEQLILYSDKKCLDYNIKNITSLVDEEAENNLFVQIVESPRLLHIFRSYIKLNESENNFSYKEQIPEKLHNMINKASEEYLKYKKILTNYDIDKDILKTTSLKNLNGLVEYLSKEEKLLDKNNKLQKNTIETINALRDINLVIRASKGFNAIALETELKINFESYLINLENENLGVINKTLTAIASAGDKITNKIAVKFEDKQGNVYVNTSTLISNHTAEKTVGVALNIHNFTLNNVWIKFNKPNYLDFLYKQLTDTEFEEGELPIPKEELNLNWLHENKVPNIMPNYLDKLNQDYVYYVMQEKMSDDGKSLFSKDVKFDSILKNIIQITEAVACMHDLDVLHGDLKPDNILIQTKGADAFLADLGFVQFIENGISEQSFEKSVKNRIEIEGGVVLKEMKLKDKTNCWSGTPGYMAPEIDPGLFSKEISSKIKREETDSKKTDDYALGATILEITTRRVLVSNSFTMKNKKILSEDDIKKLTREVRLSDQFKNLKSSDRKTAELLLDLSVELMQIDKTKRMSSKKALEELKKMM